MRTRLASALAALALGLASTLAHAQDFPTRTITIIVPFPAGGPLDTMARAIGPRMAERLGQSIVIENVGGVGGTLGATRTARAAPDGHTLLLHNLALAASGTLYPQANLDPAASFLTVGYIANNPLVLVGRKTLAPTSITELKAWMQANRAKISHPGAGTTGHLTSVVLGRAMGGQIDLVPYRGGGPALQDVVAGHVDLFFATPLAVMELVHSGGVKAYGVTAPAPIAQLPGVGSFAKEVSPDLEVLFWIALFAHAQTPKPVVAKVSAALEHAIADPAIVAPWQKAGMTIYPKERRTPEAGDAIFRAEVKRWAQLIRDNSIKVD